MIEFCGLDWDPACLDFHRTQRQDGPPMGHAPLVLPVIEADVREPMDVCLSCYSQDFLAQPFSHDLGHIGLYYREYERLMAHWRAVLPLPVLEVGYEELVSDPEGVSRGMIEFCGLDWDPACLDFHRTQRPILTASHWQARQPLYDSAVGRWKNFEAHLAPLKAALEGTL